MSILSAAQAAAAEPPLSLDSPAGLLQLRGHPAVLLLPLKQRLEVHRNTEVARLLAAEQRLAWARSTHSATARSLLPPGDGLVLYQSSMARAAPEQQAALRRLRDRRLARGAPPSAPPARRGGKVVRLDALIAGQLVPTPPAFHRFRSGAAPAQRAGAGREARGAGLCALRPAVGPQHVLSQHLFATGQNPDLAWQLEGDATPTDSRSEAGATGSGLSTTAHGAAEARRKEGERRELAKVEQACGWFEEQLRLGDGSGADPAKYWGGADPQRTEKLVVALQKMLDRLPDDVRRRRERQQGSGAAAADSVAQEGAATRTTAAEPAAAAPADVRTDFTREPTEARLEPGLAGAASLGSPREERFFAIERRLAAMRAAERLESAAARGVAHDRLDMRMARFDSDRDRVSAWGHRHRTRIATHRLEGRNAIFERCTGDL